MSMQAEQHVPSAEGAEEPGRREVPSEGSSKRRDLLRWMAMRLRVSIWASMVSQNTMRESWCSRALAWLRFLDQFTISAKRFSDAFLECLTMNGLFSSAAELALSEGSCLRHCATNFLKAAENWSPFNPGGGSLRILRCAVIGSRSKYGGSPSASSMAVMPSDQMSEAGPALWMFARRKSSGAIQ